MEKIKIQKLEENCNSKKYKIGIILYYIVNRWGLMKYYFPRIPAVIPMK